MRMLTFAAVELNDRHNPEVRRTGVICAIVMQNGYTNWRTSEACPLRYHPLWWGDNNSALGVIKFLVVLVLVLLVLVLLLVVCC
jgi:hypothetical protein